MILLVLSGPAMAIGSSPLRTTNSNLQSRSAGGPNRPQTAGLRGLHRNRDSLGKKRSKTSSAVYPKFQSGKSGCALRVGNEICQFNATHVSSYDVLSKSVNLSAMLVSERVD